MASPAPDYTSVDSSSHGTCSGPNMAKKKISHINDSYSKVFSDAKKKI